MQTRAPERGSEARRRREYDRWLRSPQPSALFLRWAMTPVGQWLVNSPLLRLPENLKVTPDQRWLDVGCGRGGLLRAIDERVGFTTPPVGVDFSGEAVRLAEADAADAGVDLRFVVGSATALPFADQAFDLVTMGYVVKHLRDAELRESLDEVYRVLQPGGLALIWEFGPVHSPLLERWNKRVLTTGVREPRLRSTRRLQRFANEAGFEFTRPADLRPFFLPPIPRASILVGRAPEGWTAQDGRQSAGSAQPA